MERPVKVLRAEDEKIHLLRSSGFFAVHIMALMVFFVGFSWPALIVCILAYGVRMFGITAGFHRYFSHRSYKTHRWFQFILALIGTSAAQKGPLWWAAHHRHHHRFSDQDEDIHSPTKKGFFWSHVGWILSTKYDEFNPKHIHDFMKFPELRFLNRFFLLPPIVLAVGIFGLGVWMESAYPEWGTNGFQMLVWGFFLSTVITYHFTFFINSLTHVFGSTRFKTTDTSRNNFFTAIITLGEGWHNNHHRYPVAESQGMYWWEVDISHYILVMLSWVGIVYDIKKHPKSLYEEAERTKLELASEAKL